MKLECVNEYLLSKGFEIEQSYKGNKYYCSIYYNENKKVHIWYNDDNIVDNCYIQVKSNNTDITGLQRPYNLIEEIREFKINKIIKKEDTSL